MNNNILIEKVGIDKTILCNFKVYNIDSNKINNKKNVKIVYNDNSDFTLSNGARIGELLVQDKAIGELKISRERDNLLQTYYINQQLSLKINSSDNNLQNLNVAEYRKRIKEAFEYLERIYGIYIDDTDMEIKQLEINATFKLNEIFADYEKALLLITQNMPSRYYGGSININSYKYATWHEANKRDNTKKLETIYIANDSVQLKIYNKGKQLSDTNAVNEFTDNIIRIEYTFKNKKSIKSNLRSNFVADLDDKEIIEVFMKYFNRDIVVPYNKWHSDNREELIKLVKKHKTKSRRWVSNFIRDCREQEQKCLLPVLFDIEDMKIVFKSLNSKNASNKYYKFKKQTLLYEKDLQGNTRKIEEIIQKVLSMNTGNVISLDLKSTPLKGYDKNKAS